MLPDLPHATPSTSIRSMSNDANRSVGWLSLGLALLTLAVYAQVATFDFVNFDDPDYVYSNPVVRQGLTWHGVVWAFGDFQIANWHPLTWLSHMLDCELFGVRPGWHHMVNVLIHSANASLLFVLLVRMTGAVWRSLFVAALFALHPTHVESVAWISERKDVLSTFFGFLSILAYTRWVRDPRRRVQPWAALGWFVLSLLAKPMLVTMPFLLLLFDVWPLQRVENTGWRTFFSRCFWKLALEKIPWFGLTFAMSVVTFLAQKSAGAVMRTESLPVTMRLANVFTAYGAYLKKLFWPQDLALFYPLPKVWLIQPFLIGAAAVLALSVLAVLWARRRPHFTFGWLWYLGTLVPVIGLVQVGAQSMADRYTYIPSIGIFIAVAWLAHELFQRFQLRNSTSFYAGATLVLACAWLTRIQLSYWQNSVAIFSHALAVTRDNPIAANNLAAAYADRNRLEDALKLFRLAIEINDVNPLFRANIGDLLSRMGRHEEALENLNLAVTLDPTSGIFQNLHGRALMHSGNTNAALQAFRRAIELKPDNPDGYNNLGGALTALGEVDEAMTNLQRALKIDSTYLEAYNNLGAALVRKQRYADALVQYQKALSFHATNAVTLFNAGVALERLGRFPEATSYFQRAVQVDPKHVDARFNLARRLFVQGNPQAAAMHFEEVIRRKPEHGQARLFLGLAQFETGNEENAVTNLKAAVNVAPNSVEALNGLAWALATASNETVRDGATAVDLATRAAELTQHQRAPVLHTLAAAHAAAGAFQEAIRVASQAEALATAQGQADLATRVQEASSLYRQQRPLTRNAEN